MARKLSFAPSRHTGARFFRWSVLALAGVGSGMMLGEMASGTRQRADVGGPASYSHLSANPDALVAQGDAAAPCPDCVDSYGVAARLRADREDRMSDGFRALGAVDVEIPPEPIDDGYRYGGRFPDPPSAGEPPVTAQDAIGETPGGIPTEEAGTPTGDY